MSEKERMVDLESKETKDREEEEVLGIPNTEKKKRKIYKVSL